METLKTYRVTSTVKVCLANGQMVTHENAGVAEIEGAASVFDPSSGDDIQTYEPGEYSKVTRTIECREVRKRDVYIVRNTDGSEYTYTDLHSAYNSVVWTKAYAGFESIRREERDELI